MDKAKGKDDMLAAGKKRLERFRQKKQSKAKAYKDQSDATSIPLNPGVDAQDVQINQSVGNNILPTLHRDAANEPVVIDTSLDQERDLLKNDKTMPAVITNSIPKVEIGEVHDWEIIPEHGSTETEKLSNPDGTFDSSVPSLPAVLDVKTIEVDTTGTCDYETPESLNLQPNHVVMRSTVSEYEMLLGLNLQVHGSSNHYDMESPEDMTENSMRGNVGLTEQEDVLLPATPELITDNVTSSLGNNFKGVYPSVMGEADGVLNSCTDNSEFSESIAPISKGSLNDPTKCESSISDESENIVKKDSLLDILPCSSSMPDSKFSLLSTADMPKEACLEIEGLNKDADCELDKVSAYHDMDKTGFIKTEADVQHIMKMNTPPSSVFSGSDAKIETLKISIKQELVDTSSDSKSSVMLVKENTEVLAELESSEQILPSVVKVDADLEERPIGFIVKEVSCISENICLASDKDYTEAPHSITEYDNLGVVSDPIDTSVSNFFSSSLDSDNCKHLKVDKLLEENNYAEMDGDQMLCHSKMDTFTGESSNQLTSSLENAVLEKRTVESQSEVIGPGCCLTEGSKSCVDASGIIHGQSHLVSNVADDLDGASAHSRESNKGFSTNIENAATGSDATLGVALSGSFEVACLSKDNYTSDKSIADVKSGTGERGCVDNVLACGEFVDARETSMDDHNAKSGPVEYDYAHEVYQKDSSDPNFMQDKETWNAIVQERTGISKVSTQESEGASFEEIREDNARLEHIVSKLQNHLSKKEAEMNSLSLKFNQLVEDSKNKSSAVGILSGLLQRMCVTFSHNVKPSIGVQHLIEFLQRLEREAVSTQESRTCNLAFNYDWLLHEYTRLIGDLERYLGEKEQMQDSVKTLEISLSRKESGIKELTDKVTMLTENCDLMSEETDRALAQKCFWEEKVKDLEVDLTRKIGELQGFLSQKEASIEQLSGKILDLSLSCERMSAECAKCAEEKLHLEADLKELQAKSDADLQVARKNLDDFSLTCVLMSEESVKKDEEKISLELEIKRLQSGIEEMEKFKMESARLETLSSTQESIIGDYITKVTDLEKELQGLRSELEYLNVQNLRLEEMEALRTENARLETLSSTQNSIIKEHDHKVTFLEKEIMRLEGDLKTEIAKLEEMEHLKKENARLEALSLAQETIIKDQDHKITDLVEEIKRLQSELEDLKNDNERADEIEKLKMENTRLEGLSLTRESIIQDHGGKVAELENEIMRLQSVLREMENFKTENARLEALLSTREREVNDLGDKCTKLSHSCELLSMELVKSAADKLTLEEGLHKLQTLTAEHDRIGLQVAALLEKVSTNVTSELTDYSLKGISDSLACLDDFITALVAQHDATCKEANDYLQEVSLNKAELESLKSLLASKEGEASDLFEQIHFLRLEVDKLKEEKETKCIELQQTEQRLLTVREKLSVAVTKGKGLVQQRDNLKQSLAEKSAELEGLQASYMHELQTKSDALQEVKAKLMLYAESGERVEALESELSYIRNSANLLRESFLQKDAILQKIEELLEDIYIPEELHSREIVEKIEWLIEAYHQKVTEVDLGKEGTETQLEHQVAREREREIVLDRGLVPNFQQLEELNKKYEDLLRKYQGMAEQSAMLEQSLLERNFLIQKWEEMLNTIAMPATVKSKEPEDRLEWLGRSNTELHAMVMKLQDELGNSQSLLDTLNITVQKLEENNYSLLTELRVKDSELNKLADDYGQLAQKLGTEHTGKFEQATMERPSDLSDLLAHMRSLIAGVIQADQVDSIFSGGSLHAVLEELVGALVEQYKSTTLEVEALKDQLTQLLSNVDAFEKLKEQFIMLEQQVKTLQEQLRIKDLEVTSVKDELDAVKSSLGDKVQRLLEQNKLLTDDLAVIKDELAKTQLENNQAEEKLSSVRDKLSMAVKKGKSVVQQRDALKQSLDEKIMELGQMHEEHSALHQTFNETDERLKHMLQRVEMLESELSSSHLYVTNLEQSLQANSRNYQKLVAALDKVNTNGGPSFRDPLEKMYWLSQALADAYKKVGMYEQEAKKAKNVNELLTLELEETQGRLESLTDELTHVEKNSSLLMEEKKLAEAAKAEAGLRLEHAMANVNSLLFELSELRESKTNLEQENLSLKDALTAQVDEIRLQKLNVEQHLKDSSDIYLRLTYLKEVQASFRNAVASEFSILNQSIVQAWISAEKVYEQFCSTIHSNIPPTNPQISLASNYNFNQASQFSTSARNTRGWTQEDFVASSRIQCQEMEEELHCFENFFKISAVSISHDSTKISEMLVEACNAVDTFLQLREAKLNEEISLLRVQANNEQAEKQRECEELQGQVADMKCVLDNMDQQKQVFFDELQRASEELELKNALLQTTQQELDLLCVGKESHEKARNEAERRILELSARVDELEKANQDLEASFIKASTRFSNTVNNFTNFQKLSEKLIAEAEVLHTQLEARDMEISQLRDQLTVSRGEMANLQNMVDERFAQLSSVARCIQDMIGGTNAGDAMPKTGSRQEILEVLITRIQAGTENLQVQLARKDALMQDMQMRHNELDKQVVFLQGALQDSFSKRDVSFSSEHLGISSELNEGNMGKHVALPGPAIATHVRAARKSPMLDHQSIDVDLETTKLSVDVHDDDKGHVFKPLTSSRLVPRGTRFLVDRLDGFWVAGERLLMRKPEARLSIIIYWVALHIWMFALLL